MKVLVLACLVSCVFGLQGPTPYAGGAAPCAAAVQAAPFAAPAPGAPVPFGGPLPGAPVNPALMARVKPRMDQWTATYLSGNAESHAAMYTTDSVIYPDHDYAYMGRVGARKWATKNRPANLLTGPMNILAIREMAPYIVMHAKFTDSKSPGDVMIWWMDSNGQLLVKSMVYNWDTGFATAFNDPLGNLAVKAKVIARLAEWHKLFEAGDMEGLSKLYYEFSKIFPWNDYKYDGPEGVRKVYQDSRDNGVTKTTYQLVEAEQAGDIITAWCYYRDYKGAEMIYEGTNVFTFKEIGGQLMIQYDIFDLEVEESKRNADEKMAEAYYLDYQTLWNAGNIAGVGAKYEPDATRVVTAQPTVVGAPAIQAQLQADYNNGNRYIFEVHGVKRVGDYLLAEGNQQTLKADLVTVVGEGNFMDVLKISGTTVRHYWDSYSSS